MFDLALTEKGDLMFEQNTHRSKPMKISFTVGNAKAFKVAFQVTDCIPITHDGGLKISFDIDCSRYNNKAIVLNEFDAKIQAVKIRLQSTIGDIAGHPTIGSMLEMTKHRLLTNVKVQQQVVSMVKTAITDILPDATVIVKPAVSRNANGYNQKLVIYIYENDILIFKYDVKE